MSPKIKTCILPLDNPDIVSTVRENGMIDVGFAVEDEDEICGVVQAVVYEECEVCSSEIGLGVGVED